MSQSAEQPTLVALTGQNWKLYSSLVLLHLGGYAVLFSSFVLKTSHPLFGALWFGGFAIGIVAAVILTRCIRCPICACAFLWRTMKSMSLTQWLDHGLWTTECPECRFGGKQSSEDRK
jgi:hypothetical protein